MNHTILNPFIPQISIFRDLAATFEVHLHIPGVISDIDIVPHGEYLAISGRAVPRVHLDPNGARGSLLWTDQPYGSFAKDVPLKLAGGTECVVLEARQQGDSYIVRYTVRNIVRRDHAQSGLAVFQDNQEYLNVYHSGWESSRGHVNQNVDYYRNVAIQNQSQSEQNPHRPQAVMVESQPPSQSQAQYFSENPSHIPASHLSPFQTQSNLLSYHRPLLQKQQHPINGSDDCVPLVSSFLGQTVSDTTLPVGGVVGSLANGVSSGLPYAPPGVQYGINDYGQPSAVTDAQPVIVDLDRYVIGGGGLSGPGNVPARTQPVMVDHGQPSAVGSGQPIVIDLDRRVVHDGDRPTAIDSGLNVRAGTHPVIISRGEAFPDGEGHQPIAIDLGRPVVLQSDLTHGPPYYQNLDDAPSSTRPNYANPETQPAAAGQGPTLRDIQQPNVPQPASHVSIPAQSQDISIYRSVHIAPTSSQPVVVGSYLQGNQDIVGPHRAPGIHGLDNVAVCAPYIVPPGGQHMSIARPGDYLSAHGHRYGTPSQYYGGAADTVSSNRDLQVGHGIGGSGGLPGHRGPGNIVISSQPTPVPLTGPSGVINPSPFVSMRDGVCPVSSAARVPPVSQPDGETVGGPVPGATGSDTRNISQGVQPVNVVTNDLNNSAPNINSNNEPVADTNTQPAGHLVPQSQSANVPSIRPVDSTSPGAHVPNVLPVGSPEEDIFSSSTDRASRGSIGQCDDGKGGTGQTVPNVASSPSESLQENININADVHTDKSDDNVESNIARPDVGIEINNSEAISTGEALERDENSASSEDKMSVRRTDSNSTSCAGGSYVEAAGLSNEKSNTMNRNQSTASAPGVDDAHLSQTAGDLGGSFVVVVGENENITGGVFEAVRDAIQNTTNKIVSQVTTNRIRTSGLTDDVVSAISATFQTATGGSNIRLQDTNSGEAASTNLPQLTIGSPSNTTVERPAGAVIGHPKVDILMMATGNVDNQSTSQVIMQPVFEGEYTATLSEQGGAVAQGDLPGEPDTDIPNRDLRAIQNDAGTTESSDPRITMEATSESSSQARAQWTNLDTADTAEANSGHGSPIDKSVVAGSHVGVSSSKQGREAEEVSPNQQQQVVAGSQVGVSTSEQGREVEEISPNQQQQALAGSQVGVSTSEQGREVEEISPNQQQQAVAGSQVGVSTSEQGCEVEEISPNQQQQAGAGSQVGVSASEQGCEVEEISPNQQQQAVAGSQVGVSTSEQGREAEEISPNQQQQAVAGSQVGVSTSEQGREVEEISPNQQQQALAGSQVGVSTSEQGHEVEEISPNQQQQAGAGSQVGVSASEQGCEVEEISPNQQQQAVAGSQVGVSTSEQWHEIEDMSPNQQQQAVQHGVQSNLGDSSDSHVQPSSTKAGNTLTQSQHQTRYEERLVASNLQGREQASLSVLSSGAVSSTSQDHADVSITSEAERRVAPVGNTPTSETQESGASSEEQLVGAIVEGIGSMTLVDREIASSESRIMQRANWESEDLSFHGSMILGFDEGATDALGGTTDGTHEHVDPVSVLPYPIQPLEDAESVGSSGDTKIEGTTVLGPVSETALVFRIQVQKTIPSTSHNVTEGRPVLNLNYTESLDSKTDGVKRPEAFIGSSKTISQRDAVIIGTSHQAQDNGTFIIINSAGVQEIKTGQSSTECHPLQDTCYDTIGLPISVEVGTSRVDSSTTRYSGSPIRPTAFEESAKATMKKTDRNHIETPTVIIEGGLRDGDHGPSNTSNSSSILEDDVTVARIAIPPDRAMAPSHEEAEIMENICHGIDEQLRTTSTPSSPLPPEDNLTARLSPPPAPRPASPSNPANPRDDLVRGTIGFNQGSISADPAEVAISPSQHSDQGISTVPSPIAEINMHTTFSTDKHDPSEHLKSLQIGIIPTPESISIAQNITPESGPERETKLLDLPSAASNFLDLPNPTEEDHSQNGGIDWSTSLSSTINGTFTLRESTSTHKPPNVLADKSRLEPTYEGAATNVNRLVTPPRPAAPVITLFRHPIARGSSREAD
ncbi:hypothetical protein BU17DRAFT_93155 [Hysterangium stoloniferum]|nr:hypothetical protein BU17DRAFT_93155 [Hysterangium stoloniferum]